MPQPPQRREYVFALFGRRDAGKTCFLTALAMSRTPSPSGVTCTWNQVPVEEPGAWKRQASVAVRLGTQLVQQAKDRLESGAVPRPNSFEMTTPLPVFYNCTEPTGRRFSVKIIDYPGERLRPNLTNDAETRPLSDELTALDGVLILAEYPRRDNPGPLWDELNLLSQAFHTLLDQRRKRHATTRPSRGDVLPVVLLVNKWDRHGTLDYAHPQREHDALQKFLHGRPEPPHWKLKTILEDLTQGNFAALPVSALGAITRLPDGSEIPQQVRPLRSFGLEEAIVSLVHQCDKLNQVRYSVAFMKRLCAIAAVLCGFAVGYDMLVDYFQWQNVSARLQTPPTTLPAFRVTRDWLHAYAEAPWYRHLGSRWMLLSPTTAGASLQDLDTQANRQHVTQLHTRFQELQTWGDRPALQRQELQELQQHLQQIPHPQALTKDLEEQLVTLRARIETELRTAETTLAEQRQQKKAAENWQYLVDLDAEIRELPTSNLTEAHLGALQDRIDQLPHPTVRSAEIEKRQEELHQQIRTMTEGFIKAEARTRWRQFDTQYRILMRREKQVIAAWDHLQNWPSKTADWKELLQDFKARMLSVLEAHWLDILAQNPRAWSEAHSAIDVVRTHRDIRALLSRQQLTQLKDMPSKIDAAKDRTLYQDVVDKKDRDSITRYLQDAPVKKKARAVQDYQKYLDARQSSLPLTLILKRIIWGKTWNGYENTVTVSIDGNVIIHQKGIQGYPHQSTDLQEAKGLLTAKLKDQIRLSIKVVCEPYFPWLGWRGNAGEMSRGDVLVEQLDSGSLQA